MMETAILLLAIGVGVIILIALGMWFFRHPPSKPTPTPSPRSTGGGDYTDTNAGLVPSKFVMFGKMHYYQVPENAKGTFVFLHGCARSATGFWPHSPSAPECNAFPEDVSHTKQALLNGYAILVPTPKAASLCFTAESMGMLEPIIQHFLRVSRLRGKPVYLGGCSAGGGLAVRFPSHLASSKSNLKIDGLILECATNQSPLKNGRAPPGFPPTVWVCMERDTDSIKEATAYAAALKRGGIGAGVVVSPKRKVTPDYFSDRMSTVKPSESRRVVRGLRAVGMVDAEGWVTADPHDFDKPGTKATGWMQKLKKLVPAGRQFTLGSVRTSPLYQAVSVAYAKHDHIADYTTAALKFLEAGGRGDLQALVKDHAVTVPAALKVTSS